MKVSVEIKDYLGTASTYSIEVDWENYELIRRVIAEYIATSLCFIENPATFTITVGVEK